MTSFESTGFVLEDGMRVNRYGFLLTRVVGIDLPSTKALFPPKMFLKFSLDLPRMLRHSIPTCSKSTLDGDKCPTI